MPHKNDRTDRIALVTGGTDGIGKEIALGLARRGYRLIVIGRDVEKGSRAENDMIASGATSARFLQADLGVIEQARTLATLLTNSLRALDVLVHSAGVALGTRQLTTEGIERNFATNYLSRFVLTQELLPLLERCDRAARILLISGAARSGKIYFDDINLTEHFLLPRALMQVCKANDVFALTLARRLAETRANVDVACLKVGVVKTNIRKEFPRWLKWLAPLLFDPLLAQPASVVADSALRLIDSDQFESAGVLFSHILRFKPLRAKPDLADPDLGSRLWALSERLAEPS